MNLLQYCFCFMFCFLGQEACEIPALWPGIKLAPPALESKVLTTGLLGKSLAIFLIFHNQLLHTLKQVLTEGNNDSSSDNIFYFPWNGKWEVYPLQSITYSIPMAFFLHHDITNDQKAIWLIFSKGLLGYVMVMGFCIILLEIMGMINGRL